MHQTINKTSHHKAKQEIIPNNRQIKPNSTPAGTKNPLNQQGHNQQDIKNHSLHRIKPHIPTKPLISHNTHVKRKKRHVTGVGNGAIGVEEGEDGAQNGAQDSWVLLEEEGAVLEAIEEGEEVGGGGEEAVGDGGGGGGGGDFEGFERGGEAAERWGGEGGAEGVGESGDSGRVGDAEEREGSHYQLLCVCVRVRW
ncbi:hypothetical protein ACET3Z_001855 [Daucus carota]